jgi:hypothetical protein
MRGPGGPAIPSVRIGTLAAAIRVPNVCLRPWERCDSSSCGTRSALRNRVRMPGLYGGWPVAWWENTKTACRGAVLAGTGDLHRAPCGPAGRPLLGLASVV